MPKLNVKQTPEKEVPTEVLATSITAIAEGVRKLRAGRLNDRALYLLVQDASPSVGGKYNSSKLSMKEIKAVFAGIEDLERTFLKPSKPAAK